MADPADRDRSSPLHPPGVHPTLTAEQQAAVDGLLEMPPGFATLDGPAGSGKSTVCRALRAAFIRKGRTVGLAAPTHQAARVLEVRSGAEPRTALTIAALLGLREYVQGDRVTFRRDPAAKSKLPSKTTWLVDEASMIAPDTLEIFAEEILPSHRVVFIGDAAQLPPVGYDDTSPALLQPLRFSLTQVHRNSGPILAAATRIRLMGTGRPRFHHSELAQPQGEL
jgi:exodeoxyribonuclease V alpha subunit